MDKTRTVRPHRRASRWLAPLFALLVGASAGCFHGRYLSQAARGQASLLWNAEPLDEVIADRDTPPRIRELLREVPAIKAFGERRGLRATKNYRKYVDVGRPAVAWAVTACEPLAFREKLWWFPIVGSVPYLGFFREESARDYARELDRDGWDVDVRGVSTYSTLGWFRDPIASPMIPEGAHALGDLVDVVLHESIHATIYLDDQTPFNESLASFAAPRLAAEYLAETRGAEGAESVAFLEERTRVARVDSALHLAWSQLDTLYASPLPDARKRELKAEILSETAGDVGFAVNNATLVDLRVYAAGIPELEALFEACDRDWARFWDAVRSLDEDDFPRKQTEALAPVLAPLASRACRPE